MARTTWIEGGDVNFLEHGGLWYRNLKGTRRWHVVRLTNLSDCGLEKGEPKYSVDLHEVDLDMLTTKQRHDIAESLRDYPAEIEDAMIAWYAHSEGIYAPLCSTSGNNGHKLIAQMKRLSRELEKDPEEYEKRMNRKVNRLGMSAREYQRNDMLSAMQRGIDSGDESVRMVAKIYRECGGRTLGGERVPIENLDGIWEL